MSKDFTAAELDAIRSDFPILSRVGRGGAPIAYLDASATSQKPEAVINAEADFYRRSNGAVHRGTHLLGDEATDASRARGAPWPRSWVQTRTRSCGRRTLPRPSTWSPYRWATRPAAWAGTRPHPCAWDPATALCAHAPSTTANIVPWQQLCARTGAELAWLDLTPDGRIDLDTLSVITPNTRLVAFTHVSNVTGAISPVAAITAAARAVGALILLDTCQSSAHMPLDLSALDVDFAVFSSHKMLGPTGAGALWGRRSLLAAMPPVLTGGSMIEWVTMEESTFMHRPSASKPAPSLSRRSQHGPKRCAIWLASTWPASKPTSTRSPA